MTSPLVGGTSPSGLWKTGALLWIRTLRGPPQTGGKLRRRLVRDLPGRPAEARRNGGRGCGRILRHVRSLRRRVVVVGGQPIVGPAPGTTRTTVVGDQPGTARLRTSALAPKRPSSAAA